MDALFIGRKKTAGRSVRSPLFGNIMFGDEDKVEEFVEQHPSRTGDRANGVCQFSLPYNFFSELSCLNCCWSALQDIHCLLGLLLSHPLHQTLNSGRQHSNYLP